MATHRLEATSVDAIPRNLTLVELDTEPRVLGAMLAIAREHARAAGVEDRLTLVEGDMRSFEAPEPAALVTIPFRAFLHNLTTEDQLATLGACHRALRPGGRLALNIFNPSLPLIVRWMSQGPQHWEPFASAAAADGAEAHHEYAPVGQIVTTRLRVRSEDGGWRRTTFRLRYVYRYEMEHLLARTGFEVESLTGDFFEASFGEQSTEMVWVARRSRN